MCYLLCLLTIEVGISFSSGQKTCTHIHGVFPYVYVPCEGIDFTAEFLKNFAKSLDLALNLALGKTPTTIQHVYKITPVFGM